MKDFKYLFDKNIEINFTANSNSINYKDNSSISSINHNTNNARKYNLLLPSYNPRQDKDEKSSSLVNKIINKKDFFEEKNEINENKINKINSKYSTCNNYYPRKDYSKFLNSHQQTNSSILNNINIYQQNSTFEGSGGYNKLNTRDLIEITKRRKEIIKQKKIKEDEKKRFIENNLDNIDIIVNNNLDNSNSENNNYCDEGVQTSLVNINYQGNENINKKEEPLSTIIFTDKSALINQEITFLSIQYSLKNNEENKDESKDYKNNDNDFVNIGCDTKESINKEKDKINNLSNNKYKKNKKLKKENSNIISNNNIEIEDKNNKIIKPNIKNIKSKQNINLNNKLNINDINDNNNYIINSENNKDQENENFEIINNDMNDNNIQINKIKKIKNNNDSNNKTNEKELVFTIVNNTQTSPQVNNSEEEIFMTNGPEAFKIESNNNMTKTKNNTADNNDDNYNFTITNNNIFQKNKDEIKVLNDSLEESNNNKSNKSLMDINQSKSLSNSEENELTEVEEFDQNLIFLQNESKTMSSHFNKIKKNINDEGQEESQSNNKDNILIEDIFTGNSNKFHSNKDNLDNYSKTLDIEKEESINEISSSLNIEKENKNKNINIYDNNKCTYKENVFRSKGKKNNDSLNKYNDYPTLRKINDNNNLKGKFYNYKNNLTNNNRYQNRNINYDEKDNECFDLLKLKTSDLKNNQEDKIIIKPLKQSNDNNLRPPSVSSSNKPKNSLQNNKFSSHKKLKTNICNNNKNNISGIPINPSKKRNNTNITDNLERNNHKNINHDLLKNKNNQNYLITPRCFKKKRQLNNYAEYYKLKMSMCKDDNNNFTNNIYNANKNNNNKNHKSLGHKKSTESFNK